MDDKFMLKNVRLSYPSLFSRPLFNGKEGKYQATFLIPKADEQQVTRLKNFFKEFEATLNFQVAPDKRAMRDGDAMDIEECKGLWVVKTGSTTRPRVINRDKSIIAEDDNIIYAGCYVNATISLWAQNNEYGKRVNANLRTVQFFKDGEAFGFGSIDDSDEFESLDSQESPEF